MQRSLRFTILSLFIAFASVAQQDLRFKVASNNLKSNQHFVPNYILPTPEAGHNVLVLEVPFSKPEFIAPLLANAAKGKVIEKVQLVYTTFAVSPSFDQQTLNQKRLRNLLSLLPDVFSNPMTEWELVGQTGATSPETGKTYFHGFVITWRPESSSGLITSELHSLDSLFIPKSSKTPLTGTYDPKTPRSKIKILTNPDGSTTLLDRDIPEDSLWLYMKPSGPNYSVIYAKWGDTAHSTVIVTELSEGGYKVKRTWKLEDHKSDEPIGGMSELYLHNPDSVVTSVMRRNSWTRMVIVSDVTGSMSPYTAQVLAWVPVGLSNGRCSGFVFFNDGDGKSTNSKNIGKTGGIYSIQTQHFDSVYYTLKKAMNAGDGGDLVENPVEAMIFSLNHFPVTSEIILVADNFSSPRDLELFEKINRPVHIILCGARGTVNPDYLFLARQTHGTIHTVHDDILHLDQMNEGDVVEIEGKHYLLHGEHFICNESFSSVVPR